jgi:hypothetical protein
MEHRWGERLKVALPVHIHAACGLAGQGLIVNFSVSGAFIATTLPVTPLSQVRVSFAPAARCARRSMHTGHSTFEAQVVRQNSAGFAVEWCEFGTDEVVAVANSNRKPWAHQRYSGHSAFASRKHS